MGIKRAHRPVAVWHPMRCFAAAMAIALIGITSAACVPAQAGTSCDPKKHGIGIDGDVLVRCHSDYAAHLVWVPEHFDEQPLTLDRVRYLVRLADGPTTEVKRVAVVGDEPIDGITSVDPDGGDLGSYKVLVELKWSAPTDGRPCNRIGRAPAKSTIDSETGVITTHVTWTEAVGRGRFGFCPEPQPTKVSVVDANGGRVATSTAIA